MSRIKVVTAEILGVSILSFGKYHNTPKEDRELHADHEKRTWREKLHYDKKTNEVFIPPMMFKNCLANVARYLSIQIPGQGKKTYTKKIESGILVIDEIPLGINKDDVDHEWVHVPSDGKRGGTSRVNKCFPIIQPGWKCKVPFHILDPIITEDVFLEHLSEAGQFIGIGRFRPQNNGYYGRFTVEKLQWPQDIKKAA